MQKTLGELAKFLDAEIVGNSSVAIKGAKGIKEASEGDITFIANTRYLSLIDETSASAIITSKDISEASKPLLRVSDPSYCFARVVNLFYPVETRHPKGIHKTALIGKDVKLGKNVSIGAYAIIEDGASVGNNSIIYGLTYIGYKTNIGQDCLIYPNVTLRENTILGNRVIIHSGTVIGSDGFGFVKIKGKHEKIPQVGTVLLEDDVEVGANVTIDRARFDKTIVCQGTKIDNLVQIAHNVKIGENALIVAQAGISGSTEVGKDAILAGQAGIVGHIKIGDRAIVGAQGGVTKSVPEGVFVSGYPARPHQESMKIIAASGKLPGLIKKVSKLEKKIEELEKKNDAKTKNH